MRSSVRAKRMAKRHRRLKQTAKLSLVSLMDIFTILVFFLLINTGDVQVLQDSKHIKLPESVAEQDPAENLVVMVNDKDIVVAGRPVAQVDEVLNASEGYIAGLEEELKYQASKRTELSEREQRYGRSITIMGDQHIPYELLKRVMATCAKVDYRDISLAVSRVASAGVAQVGG